MMTETLEKVTDHTVNYLIISNFDHLDCYSTKFDITGLGKDAVVLK